MLFCPQAIKGPLFFTDTDSISSNKIMKRPKQIFKIIKKELQLEDTLEIT